MTNGTLIIFLAYLHRYGWVIGMLFALRLFGLYGWGVVMLLFGVYSLIGYLCRWKHIYCSWQNAHHQKMTPYRLHWSNVKVSEAVGIPVFFIVGGLFIIVAAFFQ